MDLNNLRSEALSKKKEFKRKAQKLKRLKDKELDQFFFEKHDQVFKSIDCLSCANCCKTAGPRLREVDVERIAKYLKLSISEIHNRYTKIDEDGDLVMNVLPCPFLGIDNFCSIYDVRPKACREYPHTDRKAQKQLLNLHIKNTEYCPAVQEILKQVK